MLLGAPINEWAKAIHQNALDKGFWEEGFNLPEKLCLIHSEVSEALEAYRSTHDTRHSTVAEELIDVIIRTLDLLYGLGIDVEEEMAMKHEKNLKRSYKHGGKAC